MLCFALTVNVFWAVNAVYKSNTLTNCKLINKREKQWTELKVQLFGKNEWLLIGPVRCNNFTNRKRTDLKKGRKCPALLNQKLLYIQLAFSVQFSNKFLFLNDPSLQTSPCPPCSKLLINYELQPQTYIHFLKWRN